MKNKDIKVNYHRTIDTHGFRSWYSIDINYEIIGWLIDRLANLDYKLSKKKRENLLEEAKENFKKFDKIKVDKKSLNKDIKEIVETTKINLDIN